MTARSAPECWHRRPRRTDRKCPIYSAGPPHLQADMRHRRVVLTLVQPRTGRQVLMRPCLPTGGRSSCVAGPWEGCTLASSRRPILQGCTAGAAAAGGLLGCNMEQASPKPRYWPHLCPLPSCCKLLKEEQMVCITLSGLLRPRRRGVAAGNQSAAERSPKSAERPVRT
jgi:hypothetical protein